MLNTSDQMILNAISFIAALLFLFSAIKNYRKKSLRSITFLFAAIAFFIKILFDFLNSFTIIDRVIYSITFINSVIMFEFLIAKIILNEFENIKVNNVMQAVKKTRKIAFASNIFKAIRSVSLFHLFFIMSTYFNFIVVNNYDIYNCIIADLFLIAVSIYGSIVIKDKIICEEILLYSIFRLLCFLIIAFVDYYYNPIIKIVYICFDVGSSCMIALIAFNWRILYDKCD